MRRLPLATAVVALGVGLTAPARAQFLSPGPLAQGHARLEGDDKCGECHSSGRGVDDGKCLACHAPIARQIQARRGLHGVGYANQRCERCHLDHRGRGFRMVRWPGGDPSHLDHTLTGWPLRGAHAGKPCRACHTGSGGGARWIGTPTACRSCHEDPHESRFGQRCESCHNEVHWSEVRIESFDHSRTRYPLEGKHVQVRCPECHGQPARYRGLRFGACTDCHQDPHRGHFPGACTSCHSTTGWQDLGPIRRNHPRLSLAAGHANVECRACHDRGSDRAPSRGSACVSCHRPVHEAEFGRSCASCHRGIRWLGLPRSVGLESHGRTPFPLRGAHVEVDCDKCHDPRKSANARYRQLTFDRCLGCHQDEHRGEFASRAGGGDCSECHDDTAFRPTSFGLAGHATTAFPLTGRHQAAPCGACHLGERPRLAFHVQRQACADCHDNPHGEQFAREMRQGGCARCHTALDWRQPSIDHSTWPLTGAHQAALCDSCHSPSAEDRTAGRGASYRGVPRECEGCHEDVHAGQFRLSDPVKPCSTCHGTTDFHVQRFDHAGRTGWALDGRHRSVACSGCHAPAALRNGANAVRWRLGYRACADCHANPHRPPRRAAGRDDEAAIATVDCATCHEVSGWGASGAAGRGGRGFDHASTGFPLTGRHANASCTSCHVRGRTTRRECATCHADVHQDRLGDRCDGCHRAVSWTATRVQERHRQTRLPLDGAHALVDCAACHRRATERIFSGTPAQCFACHEADYRRADVHPSHVAGLDGVPFSRVCTECHRTVSWSPAFFPTSGGAGAGALSLAAARHDARFPIGFGPHRGASCDSCHPSERAPRVIACTGCHAHAPVRLAAEHAGRPVPADGVACLRCHPGGMAR